MKKIYCNPEAELIALHSNDVITNSVIDDIANDIFGGAANSIPFIQ